MFWGGRRFSLISNWLSIKHIAWLSDMIRDTWNYFYVDHTILVLLRVLIPWYQAKYTDMNCLFFLMFRSSNSTKKMHKPESQ